MSGTQRLITRLVDAPTAAAIEGHSRSWFARCLTCDNRRSIWDLGGVRYKAVGESLTRLPCPNCGKTTGHRLEKGENFPITHVPAWPLWRAIIIVTLGTMLVLGAIVVLILWMVGVI